MDSIIVPAVLTILLGLIIYGINSQKESAPSKADQKWRNDQKNYEALISKLPSDLVKKIEKMMQTAGLNMGIPLNDLPDELLKVFGAAGEVEKRGSYGVISKEQRSEINKALDHFDWVIKELIPASKQALENLSGSDGLGFGLITNSAADAALYTVMDTRQKIKGNERRIEQYRQSIDQEVISLIGAIRQAVS